MKQIIQLDEFKLLYYDKCLSNKEIASYFGVGVSAIGNFRNRNNLKAREQLWAYGHPMLGKKHSKEVRKRISENVKGKLAREKNPNWKGGTYLTVYGYRRVWTERGHELEHRVVMSKHLGRPLESNEIVHHINHNKLDNRLENLCIHDRSSHMREHYPSGSKFGIHNKSAIR